MTLPPLDDPSPIHAELGRVGASYRKAGTRHYISVQLGLDEIKLLGPPREHPRRTWLGPDWQALELLAALPDDAGTEAVWRASTALVRAAGWLHGGDDGDQGGQADHQPDD